MGVRVSDEDVFIIHGYGDSDNNVIFLRMDADGKLNWSRHRSVASEFTREEANSMVKNAANKGLRTWAIRVL